jgi:hypothetical protein
VTLTATYRESVVALDIWYLQGAQTGAAGRVWAHRRVEVRTETQPSPADLVELCARFLAYVRTTARDTATVARGLPWMEVQLERKPAPPGGGPRGGWATSEADIIHSADAALGITVLPSVRTSPPPGPLGSEATSDQVLDSEVGLTSGVRSMRRRST